MIYEIKKDTAVRGCIIKDYLIRYFGQYAMQLHKFDDKLITQCSGLRWNYCVLAKRISKHGITYCLNGKLVSIQKQGHAIYSDFSAVNIEKFTTNILIFLKFLLKTYMVGTR